ncbi:hypothetical protein EKD04_017450 [Chloroflexales bacterium ZM16-3]|nr:hypothetical protein [Chloroflexales bacterium ZM16-3]
MYTSTVKAMSAANINEMLDNLIAEGVALPRPRTDDLEQNRLLAAEMMLLAAQIEAEREAASRWPYALEMACGRDGLADAERRFRQIGTPAAVRMADLIQVGTDLVRIELQVSLWIAAGMTSHCQPTVAGAEALALANEVPADLDAIGVAARLAALDKCDRLPYWNE